ncbi:Transcriptional regulator, AsnC family OS=Tsukamurella paurometabola (strain ATCC 8368 / DSM/ CCUG 35730 / CIP 100753 / JCM 10117 / KCTC 9821 / NBRC 16120/ NCIMB 702349 / NCTC 13040) OX=521096 GN=Tpau_4074 PE=4 SV=1 [Tsukamurella paurometabola]|uniref:Transcriptional regulator, AsnC family n=1 Tax=Tsukamurella paurometabola (strain ATCC 8368 / DSM 20162 / CCUG 35730 / CIP 100753 / JCM 10117 / KCTC 9821 / NBRC 16120 / NCIMB 702349 / NCTC 13040) TaxID=521096 RepID=D5UNE9_TSUPD|nr:transcriptional regulator, AsnC family [Tsukamurella paurometabola DSM 20162]SUP40408.1 Leucine-responsive regulatory protein [Tsukamurella paurometabola]
MDAIDRTLLDLLVRDGRMSHRELAAAAGITRATVASRLRRLLDSGAFTVQGVVHPSVLGRGTICYVRIEVDGPAGAIAEAVASLPEVVYVSITTGRFAVAAEIRAGSAEAVDGALARLRGLPGVARAETLAYREVHRDAVGPVGDAGMQLDATDIALLRVLERDGRASYVHLATQAGLSAAAARRRVLRLVEASVVRIGPIVSRGSEHAMGMGIHVLGAARDAAGEVADVAGVSFLARTLGTFDLLATVRAPSAAGLAQAMDAVRDVRSVSGVETWSHLRFVKESYASLGG